MGSQGIVSEMVQQLKEIVNFSDSEIYTMLVECDMEPNDTVMRLLSQDTFHEVKSKRNRKRDTKDQAESSSRRIPNCGARNSAKDSYNNARGSGNKFNSNETRLAQSVPANKRDNHWAGSSSAPRVRPPPNSNPKNAEVKKAAPTGSTGAATSSSLPAPAYQSAWVSANGGKKTMAEIVKMGKPLHQKKVFLPRSSETQESGSKAPLKDEGSSVEKKDVSEPVSAEPKTHAGYQVSEPQHVDKSRSSDTQESGSKAPLKDEGSSVEKQHVSDLVSSLLKPSAEPKTHAVYQVSEPQHVDKSQMDDEVPEIKTNPVASHPDVDLVVQCSQLRFGTFGSKIGSGQTSSGFNDILQDTKETGEDSSFRNLENNFYGAEEEEQLRDNATDEQGYIHIDLTTRNDHASSYSVREAAQHEPPQEGPQMQNLESLFTNVMDLRGAGQHAAAVNQHPALNAYRHQHPALNAYRHQRAAAPLNQHPAFNADYRQHGMPLRHHGNFTSHPYAPHGYMHSSFQQGFPVGNHQAPPVGALSPSASSLQYQQNENTRWHQVARPYIFSAHTSQHPRQLYQQQLSQQAAVWRNPLHHHQHHDYHHQQSGGEAYSRTREQLWPNNN